ncbi:hydrolase, alpha/beta fold domain containing protein [Acanthamoeba castellanii str. Neff]|uniref:Hydrolase, alpha/beta fold domain containing protein n=1 Tax=Acanthamoeba castellanii (strain ATCC 30010 / Neff) TaxID=1257118 RepID=L8HCE2_ACACF|nr:hydrolase, alpha/beta fold domain containing protein [Acanthamoeba castellanii str. Neff]ELR22423.1 hydrolase, alpha/beta fold domain containing protein [Acanthamoeba castellanii str. Neff]
MEGREDEVVVAIAVDEKVRLSKGEVHYRLERPTHMNPTSPTTRACLSSFACTALTTLLACGTSSPTTSSIYGVKDNHASRDYRPPPLRTDGFTLVGHSMGGAVSLLVAHRYPDLVEKLVLIGPAGMKFSVPLEMQLMRLPALGPRLFQWFAKQDDMMKEDFMDLEASKNAIAHVMEHTQGMYGSYAFACAFINSFTWVSTRGRRW